MTVQIKYKNNLLNKNTANLVYFVDDKFNISSLKKHVLSTEFSFISDLIKTKDIKKKIVTFEISSKKKIILISLKKNLTISNAVNLGAKFFDKFKDFKPNDYRIISDTIPSQLKYVLAHFLHGLKLKSYLFDKYKTKKNKKIMLITVTGKNKPNLNDQIKFKAIEDGTFYTRDLVSEPGNILHPDEYAKRLKLLKKDGLKINILDEK